jgi:hypothetical protein
MAGFISTSAIGTSFVVGGNVVTQQHYKWSARDQRWKLDGAELVLIIAAVALITAVMMLGLVLR